MSFFLKGSDYNVLVIVVVVQIGFALVTMLKKSLFLVFQSWTGLSVFFFTFFFASSFQELGEFIDTLDTNTPLTTTTWLFLVVVEHI